MESMGRLAGGVAHDFNNLLAVILSYSGFVLEELPENDPIREDLEEIQRSGELAKVLTRQLLAFSRQQVLDPKTLDVNEVTEGIVRMLEHTIGEDINLALSLAQDIDPIIMDRGQLEQILVNLATNARDAMPEGGELRIETANRQMSETDLAAWPSLLPGGYVQLSVTDNGEGIPDKIRSRIFDPFFTTKPLGKGTGLGLSTVYGIIQQSGGVITVESAPSRGTCMRILLPKGKQSARHDGCSLPAGFKATGTQTVLVVEDSGPMQKMVVRILSAAGYKVLATDNASEALRVCEQHEGPIHLLLTDVIMPEMNGRQLAERVTALRPEITVLFMSGYAHDTIGRHGILEPGTNFIAKPFDSSELRNKVFEVLKQS